MKILTVRRLTACVTALILTAWALTLAAAPLPPVDCVITPNITVELSSPIPGALTEILVDRSDQVSTDQVVARMDSGVEQATVALARERSTMQAEIHLEKVNLEFDHREEKRLSSLYGNNLVAERALDDARRSSALTNWKLQQARDLVRLRVLELNRAEELLEQKWIRSPIDGVVIQRYKQPGEYVEDQAILQIAQLDVLAVEAIVPMELFYGIDKGMAADIYAETDPSRSIRAHVSVVDRMGDASSGTFGVRLTLPNSEMAVPAGVKCTVQFLPDQPLMVAEISDPAPREILPEPVVAAAMVREPEPEPESPVDIAPEPPADAVPELQVDAAPEPPVETASQPPVETEPELPIAATEETGGNNWPPAEIDEPAPIPPACTSIGPVADRVGAERLLERFNSQGLPAQLRSVEEVAGGGYYVLSMKGITAEQLLQIQQIMQENGQEDFLQHGKALLAFGFFSTLERAERRRQQLAALEIDSRILDKTRSVSRWWLDVEIDTASESWVNHEAWLAESGMAADLRAVSCQPRMAER